MNDEHMKKGPRKTTRGEMRGEYDFTGGTRGKYAARFAEGTNLVKLDSDVAEVFRSSAAVNRALRALSDAAHKVVGPRSNSALERSAPKGRNKRRA